jgi:cytochrome c
MRVAVVTLMLSTGLGQAMASDDDVAKGKALYETTCGGCHSVDEDRIGPHHRDIVGRPVASAPGFDYSTALKMLGGTWTPERLDEWLSGTQKMAPGSKMYLELDDPHQRQLIIAFLESVSMKAPAKGTVDTHGP